MNSLDTRSVSMLACLFMEGLGALASWISAGKVWEHQISFFTLRDEFRKCLTRIKISGCFFSSVQMNKHLFLKLYQ